VESPEFECAGHRWKLQLYPGGSDHSRYGFVSLSLVVLLPSESPDIKLKDYMMNVKKFDGQNHCRVQLWENYTFIYEEDSDDVVFSSDEPPITFNDFMTR
jgi:hypothetical protein